MTKTFVGIGLALAMAAAAFAQRPELPAGDPARTWKESDSKDGRWNESEVGPFLASVLRTPGGAIAKGLSVKVGDKQQATVAYDTATCTMRCAWTGGFLKFSDRRYGITSSPEIAGNVQFNLSAVGWGKGEKQYLGLYQDGNTIALEYTIDGVAVVELPAMSTSDNVAMFTRSFHIAPHEEPLSLSLVERPGKRTIVNQDRHAQYEKDGRTLVVALTSTGNAATLQHNLDSVTLRLNTSEEPTVFTLHMSMCDSKHAATTNELIRQTKVDPFVVPKKPLWPDWIATGGSQGKGGGAYVIDTVNVPFDNPYKALMFTSGFDFFTSGDIAVSTLHGDVWLVRGVDDDLTDVKWKRYATGLCQPLGLRIVEDKVYVLGKDQITRLHDRNMDDEADFYECFNNDGQTSLGGHDYASCLETDSAGNFYYIRAHEGVCRVSADGKTHKSLATGFRNPIGLGVSPDGMVTAAPQEGTWTPSSAIFAIKEGGYYGFGGPRKSASHPQGFEPPLCWMPRSQDNSSGGQVWVTSDKWGLPRNTMLHLSYGLCTALIVMPQQVEGTYQGGTVKLPLFFESGACRGRFSPRDGQLYVCGLMGWQTAAAKDGCLQRVRHSGKPVHMPVGMEIKENGIAITFTHPLDPKSAGNPDNYYIEEWNYKYSKEYGSKDYRVSEPKKFGRDEMLIDAAELSDGNRTVFLETPDIGPVMQMGITYQIESADGTKLKNTIYNTINLMPQ